jgi:hypothetical protein
MVSACHPSQNVCAVAGLHESRGGAAWSRARSGCATQRAVFVRYPCVVARNESGSQSAPRTAWYPLWYRLLQGREFKSRRPDSSKPALEAGLRHSYSVLALLSPLLVVPAVVPALGSLKPEHDYWRVIVPGETETIVSACVPTPNHCACLGAGAPALLRLEREGSSHFQCEAPLSVMPLGVPAPQSVLGLG